MLTAKIANKRNLRFALAAFLVLTFLAFYLPSRVCAKTKKAKYGTIKILSSPGGLLLTIDGKPYGETTTEYRSIDLDPGLHSVSITLPGGRLWIRDIDLPAGRIKCVAVNYRPLPPLPKSPCPFPVNVSAPKQVNEGEIITYTTDLSYGGNASLVYGWKVSPAGAYIISGAGSPTLTVDSTGLGGQPITATLVVDDGSGDRLCRQSAQASTIILAQEKKVLVGREFDECDNCSFDDQKARLDNLAVELQNDPTTSAHILAYGGRNSPIGQADRLMTRARDYLIQQRGIDASRIVIVNGGFRENDSVELWIVPSGAAAPRPTPTLQAGTPKSPAVRRRN